MLIPLLIKWNQQMQLIWYCTNVNAEIRPEPILCINACITIDTIWHILQTDTSGVNRPLDKVSTTSQWRSSAWCWQRKHLFCTNVHNEGAVFLWSTSCLLTKRQKEGSNKKACQSYANRPLAGIRTGYIVKNFEHILAAGGPGWGPGPGSPPWTDRLTDRCDWKHYLCHSVGGR